MAEVVISLNKLEEFAVMSIGIGCKGGDSFELVIRKTAELRVDNIKRLFSINYSGTKVDILEEEDSV